MNDLPNPVAQFPPSQYEEWINQEEDFIHANRERTRDGDLDESVDVPSIRTVEEAPDRSIAKGSRARARAVPGNPEQVREAQEQEQEQEQEQQERSRSSCCTAAQAADRTFGCSTHESSPAGTEDEDCPSILDGLPEERQFAHRSDHELLGKSLSDEKKTSDRTPLDQCDRTQTRLLLKNKNLNLDDRLAIQWFLGEFKRSKWMHWQGFYPERIAMTTLSSWHRGKDVAYCRYAGRFCHEPDFCPQCALMERADPAITEYDGLFDRLLRDRQRRFFYAVTLSYDWNPERAGVHYVVEKRDPQRGTPDVVRHEYPFKGQSPVEPLTIDHDIGEDNNITACFRAIFDLAKFLRRV